MTNLRGAGTTSSEARGVHTRPTHIASRTTFRGLTTGGAYVNARIEHFGPAMRVISRRAGEAKGTACRCYQGDESIRVIAEPCRRQYSAHPTTNLLLKCPELVAQPAGNK